MSALPKRQSSVLVTSVKLALCGTVIFAIAFAFAVMGTDGDVSESHADITWLSPFERSNTESFNQALSRLGHDEPRRYDLNGNTVYFSTNTTHKMPLQVMVEYQEEFVRQGLNERIFVHLSDAERDERTTTALMGGLAPLAISDDYVVLAGVVTANGARDSAELLQNYADAEDRGDLFRAHRYIEISRGADSRHTSIVSSWSDEDFDYRRMIPGSDAQGQAFDSSVPACPGCTRLTRFADDDPRVTGQVDLAFIGPRSAEDTRAYYHRTLSQDGWQRQESTNTIAAIEDFFGVDAPEGQSDQFHRDGQQLTLIYLPDYRTGETLTLASRTGS